MNGEHWIDRLSEYLDGELDGLDRREADAHLMACEECSHALKDLRGIVSQARNLPDRMPTTDLWPAVAAGMVESDSGVIDLSRRLERAGAPPSIRFTVPQLAAAGVALALFSGALSWSFASANVTSDRVLAEAPISDRVLSEAPISDRVLSEAPISDRVLSEAPPGVVVATGSEVAVFAPEYAEELRELETILEKHRSELSPGTIRVLEKNLRIIDEAISESLSALEDDPSNSFLRTHIDRAFQRKVELLRETSQIAGWAL